MMSTLKVGLMIVTSILSESLHTFKGFDCVSQTALYIIVQKDWYM